MTTGPAERHSTSAGCTGRSPTAALPRRSRSAGAGWWSGPTPGSTTSASFSVAPSDAATASTPTSPSPPPSSRSVPCFGPPGTATAGTPGQDHHASADLLADALNEPSSRQAENLRRLRRHGGTGPVSSITRQCCPVRSGKPGKRADDESLLHRPAVQYQPNPPHPRAAQRGDRIA